MAEALVSIAVEVVGKQLIAAVGQELFLLAVATRELQKLSNTFEAIKAFLDDAESRQVGEKHVKLWLSRLRHAAYDFEDLVMVLMDASNHAVSRYNFLHRIKDRYNIAHSIKEIKRRLDQIAAERNNFGFNSYPEGGEHWEPARSRRQTTSFMDESEMIIGRENDKETLVSKLVSGSSGNDDKGQVQVVAIAGIGALGKTTLARLLYHDARVRDHFNQALYWVCVSESFDLIRLLKEIIEQVKGTRVSLTELNSLQCELVALLRGKRFLLILDDVWNDDVEKWEMLRLSLNSGEQGSRILVTTRSQKVANTMDATYIHRLQGLSDGHSRELFVNRAFTGRQAEEYSVLESVGKEIVNNCRGVPLLIQVMGSVMASKTTVEDWENILATKMWSLPKFEDKILPDLLLSYLNLPTYLKHCFVYCSVFPKDWEFDKDTLVRLWVAQGFIRQGENREIDDLGAKYLGELVSWSLFQQVQKDGETRYKMHGLHHDLAEFIANSEIYRFISSDARESEQWLSSEVRYAFFSFANNDDWPSYIPIVASSAKKLRTLWLHGIDRSDCDIVDMIHQQKFLRAFSFTASKSSEKIMKSLDAIWKMRHLRYLDFSGSDIVELPESVSHLRNLHTLNLTGCVKLKRLPRGMGEMVSLRYLEIERTDSLEYLPKGLGRISGLRSLCNFIVGGGEGGCQIDELQRLNSLEGILRIQYLERVSRPEEARKAELWNKPHLRRLVVSMFGRDDEAEIKRMDSVLESLRPHADLEELKLFCYTGSKLPSWMQLMQSLHKLELYGCPNLVYHLDSCPLRELMIRDCHGMEGIAGSSSVFLEKISVVDSSEFFSTGLPHLPNLKTFEIRCFRNETLPYGGWERLMALQTLEIRNCDELKSLPDGLMRLQSLEHLIIFGCDKLESLPAGLGQLKKLKALTIGVLEALECLPDSLEQLESLEHLEVSSCEKLESLPNGLQQLYLPNLKTFKIRSFINETLPPGGWEQLVVLQTLEIRNCSELKSLPDGLTQLQSLENLTIYGCDKLEWLPAGLGQLKKLKVLTIGVLEALECLPDSLEQLESLEHLEVSSCKKLESLPHGLQHLLLLQRLSICGCPLLLERCKRDGGVDWPKISHITNIKIIDK